MGEAKFDRSGSVIVLDVQIEGKGGCKHNFKMALDTGSTFVVIPPAICSAIGCLPRAKGRKINITTASGRKRLPLLKIPFIRVAGVEARNVETLPLDLPGNEQAEGLLGLTFLRRFRLEVDYARGKVRLTPRK